MWVSSYAQICRVQHAIHFIFTVAAPQTRVYEFINCIRLQERACLVQSKYYEFNTKLQIADCIKQVYLYTWVEVIRTYKILKKALSYPSKNDLTRKKFGSNKLTHPFSKKLLPLWSVNVNCLTPSDKLH